MTGDAGEMRLRAVAGLCCLAVAAGSSWSAFIAPSAIRLAAVVTLAATPALLVVGGLSRRATASVATLWVPAVMLVAGVPASAFAPDHWAQSMVRLGSAASQFVTPGGRPVAGDWSLTAVMLPSGALWMMAASVVASDVVSVRRLALAFLLLASPWLVGVAESTPDHAAWLGGLVLLGGVLWFRAAAAVIPLAVVAATLSVLIAQGIGPHQRWFGIGRHAPQNVPFTSLETEPMYGPLPDRRTGAPMLEVRAPEPALWRMQTLDYFDGGGWTAGPPALPQLPQPAARPEQVAVHVLGLRQDLVVAPGRVQRVAGRESAAPADGEAWHLTPVPRSGDTYRVVATVVRVSARQLAGDRAPLDSRARVYTRLGFSARGMSALQALEWFAGSFGLSIRAPSVPIVDPRVVELARHLAAGTRTEWDRVVRVHRFLLDGGRFRYTTRASIPSPHPVVDFLLHTHAGYCQQFAGAAALLLRLAGVPARVVAGFATGRRTGPHQYTVRDLDAHDWIEVYFPDVGWVTFNPTPSASSATIAAGVDPLRLRSAPHGRSSVPAISVLVCALVGGAALVLVGRDGRGLSRRPADPLERIARHVGGRLEPSTTLAQIGAVMARIGPRAAAVAADAERARFAPGRAAPGHRGIRLARALVSDLGPLRALLVWAPVPLPRRVRMWSAGISPTPEEREREQRQQ